MEEERERKRRRRDRERRGREVEEWREREKEGVKETERERKVHTLLSVYQGSICLPGFSNNISRPVQRVVSLSYMKMVDK